MQQTKAHAKLIRRAARQREKYEENDDLINDNSTTPVLEDDNHIHETKFKITSRHTVANVMDIIKENEQSHGRNAPLKKTGPVVTGIELSNMSKLDEFLAKKQSEENKKMSSQASEEKTKELVKHEPQPLAAEEETEDCYEGEDYNPNEIIPSYVYSWIGNVVENLQPQLPESDLEENRPSTRVRATTLDKLDQMMTNRLKFKCLEFFMESLENIVAPPVVYLCKELNPIALNLALDYVATNELTSNIVVVHIVNDRKVISSHQQILKRLHGYGMDADILEKYHKKLLVQHITGTFKEKSNDAQRKKTALSVTDVDSIEYNLDMVMSNLPEDIRALPKLVSLFDTLYT